MNAPLVSGIVYGPLQSRRFGLSLGINVSGSTKQCTFGCRYCFRGPPGPRGPAAFPRSIDVVQALEVWLSESELAGRVEDFTIAGNGEPTMHPALDEVVEAVVRIRDRHVPRVKISILSNGMGLVPRLRSDHAAVRRALGLVDRPCLKVDAGTETMFERLSQPASHVTLAEWIDAAIGTQPMMVQTMLVQGDIDNTTPQELEALCDTYRRLEPSIIHLVTINKPTHGDALQPVSAAELLRIRAHIAQGLSRAPFGVQVVSV